MGLSVGFLITVVCYVLSFAPTSAASQAYIDPGTIRKALQDKKRIRIQSIVSVPRDTSCQHADKLSRRHFRLRGVVLQSDFSEIEDWSSLTPIHLLMDKTVTLQRVCGDLSNWAASNPDLSTITMFVLKKQIVKNGTLFLWIKRLDG